ncbi:MAG: tRNA (guanosine(37)-N1)-methyltransferase TrmD [Gammaproteobacteria bacterium]|nr:tRNA (guanosine(37)-N1)-methyltransferase TrmD [Gammaproteobacteria bacterium]MCZ6579430.1 tRNA (guanosine(37)-N1)-methyltransferase TrmD [Gammaproteobacteria bacterium]MCZ6797710.1 tRNA (guanosine(37)-N1)-methyltransferase TrmD [Gammaproteobacteria bacterium]MCZ6881688.1 tRNA (guanosine(37)-N1)-methyltransferase TrmD [Gammaproteobacteria bacterium]
MRVDVITLFPELVKAVVGCGVVGRAADQGLLELNCWNPRDYASDRHRTVDDRPYGGGPGMLMKVQPLQDTIQAVRQNSRKATLVYLSPQGILVKQDRLAQQVEQGSVIFLCGRYEGIDERLIQQEVDEEWSIGDYVISGGELAAMVCIDAMTRLIPGALGHEQSALQDSFSEGMLDCTHYTRPEEFQGIKVPEVLMNGNHQEIQNWREKQSLGRTWQRRPDLLEHIVLDDRQQALLKEYIDEFG